MSILSSMKNVLFLSLTLSFSTQAFADCRSAYADKIKQLDGRTNPPMATMATNGVASVAVPGIILAAGGALTVAGTVALPVAAVGAGIYYGVLITRKKSFQKSLKLINDAIKGNGAQLDRFAGKVLGINSNDQKAQLISFLVKANSDNLFCPEDGLTGKVKPLGFREIRKLVAGELSEDSQDMD